MIWFGARGWADVRCVWMIKCEAPGLADVRRIWMVGREARGLAHAHTRCVWMIKCEAPGLAGVVGLDGQAWSAGVGQQVYGVRRKWRRIDVYTQGDVRLIDEP